MYFCTFCAFYVLTFFFFIFCTFVILYFCPVYAIERIRSEFGNERISTSKNSQVRISKKAREPNCTKSFKRIYKDDFNNLKKFIVLRGAPQPLRDKDKYCKNIKFDKVVVLRFGYKTLYTKNVFFPWPYIFRFNAAEGKK